MNNKILASLAADFEFVGEQGDELQNGAERLRYVAAINPEASRAEFVLCAVKAGYPANTSANRFRESRKFDQEAYGLSIDKDGRLIGA
jgi:hypothetical protein